VKLTMRSQLLGGLSRWFFEADENAPVGYYTFRATLYTPNGVLTDITTITVAVAPEAKPKSNATEPETGPDVRWVYRPDWPNHEGNLDARTAGYVTEDEAETIIWVNRHLDVLDDSLRRRALTREQVTSRTDRYLYPIACALWLQHHSVQSADPRPSDSYLKQEMRRVAEAILVAIDPDIDVIGEEDEE
jgi:phenylpropionate dioxygenase-like ring-hydroxylating dioxygenase large terminal subunit